MPLLVLLPLPALLPRLPERSLDGCSLQPARVTRARRSTLAKHSSRRDATVRWRAGDSSGNWDPRWGRVALDGWRCTGGTLGAVGQGIERIRASFGWVLGVLSWAFTVLIG